MLNKLIIDSHIALTASEVLLVQQILIDPIFNLFEFLQNEKHYYSIDSALNDNFPNEPFSASSDLHHTKIAPPSPIADNAPFYRSDSIPIKEIIPTENSTEVNESSLITENIPFIPDIITNNSSNTATPNIRIDNNEPSNAVETDNTISIPGEITQDIVTMPEDTLYRLAQPDPRLPTDQSLLADYLT